jgi:hypothetical protein
MLFMIIVGASRASESGAPGDPELMAAMDRYNEELVAAGVRVMARGLHPSAEGLRVRFRDPDGAPEVATGPFLPTEHVVAGFFLLDVADREEAERWLLRAPDPQGNGEGWIELRQVHGAAPDLPR